jgi:hypothetical protein
MIIRSLKKLALELQKTEYSMQTDTAIRDDLNKTINKNREAPMENVRSWGLKMNLMKRLEDSSADVSDLKEQCKWLFQGNQDSVDLTLTGVSSLLASLVSKEICTQSEINELMAYGKYTTTVAKELGYTEVTEAMVKAARGK